MKRVTFGVLISILLVLSTLQVAWAAPPSANPVVHIVRWGENLTNIARQYGTTVPAIVAANHLINANRIYAATKMGLRMSDNGTEIVNSGSRRSRSKYTGLK